MKRVLIIILFLSVLMNACGGGVVEPTPAPQTTSTPDPCSSANLPGEVAKVNNLMREFDDYSALASKTPQSQIVQLIPDMQRVLRDAEDLRVPPCLTTLKKLQLTHMTYVIQTLVAFMNSADVKLIDAGIAQARQLHKEYDIEIARLLGITVVVPTSSSAP